MCLLNTSKVPGRLQQIGKLYMHVPCACWQTVCAECAVQTVFQMIKLFIPVDLCKTKYACLHGYSAWQMLKLSLTAIYCKLNLPG